MEGYPPALLGDIEALLVDVCRTHAAPVVVFSGSLPPVLPPDTYARLTRAVSLAGGRAVVDTSGPALSAALSAAPCLLKPNRDELSQLLGRSIADSSLTELAPELQRVCAAHRIAWILASDGPRGVVLVNASQAWSALYCGPPLAIGTPTARRIINHRC